MVDEIDSKVEIARFSGAAAGITVWGVTLNEWVAIATLVYLAIQIFILLPKAIKLVVVWYNNVFNKK